MDFSVERKEEVSEVGMLRPMSKTRTTPPAKDLLEDQKRRDFEASLEYNPAEDAEARLLEAFEFLLGIQESPDFTCEPETGLERFEAEIDSE